MKNKKKFHFSLEKDLKPDLADLVEQSEKEFTEYAQKIFEMGAEEKKENFRIQDLYQAAPLETTSAADDNYLSLLENARLEAIEKAAQIFKNEE